MLRSGNDAAFAIAKYIGGNVDNFVSMMNNKAKELGMNDTTYNNPNGLDDKGGNLSSTYDMSLLTSYAMKNDEYRNITKTKKHTLKTNMNYYSWTNKNKLLYLYKYANGGKTGYTKKAKRTLVTSASKNDVNLICVTFIDSDDFNTHKKLYEYGFNTYKKYLIINKRNLKIKGHKGLYVKNNYYYLLKDNEKNNIKVEAIINKENSYISVLFNNKEVHREKLYKR
jgi:D-alanyl-D-alanine carboxypeptidase